jgi:hypothetical protein
MIPLQNLDEEHIGFLLPAGLPADFASTVGRWEGDCVFMALPAQRMVTLAGRVLGEQKAFILAFRSLPTRLPS